jgi:hypothetical protein
LLRSCANGRQPVEPQHTADEGGTGQAQRADVCAHPFEEPKVSGRPAEGSPANPYKFLKDGAVGNVRLVLGNSFSLWLLVGEHIVRARCGLALHIFAGGASIRIAWRAALSSHWLSDQDWEACA